MFRRSDGGVAEQAIVGKRHSGLVDNEVPVCVTNRLFLLPSAKNASAYPSLWRRPHGRPVGFVDVMTDLQRSAVPFGIETAERQVAIIRHVVNACDSLPGSTSMQRSARTRRHTSGHTGASEGTGGIDGSRHGCFERMDRTVAINSRPCNEVFQNRHEIIEIKSPSQRGDFIQTDTGLLGRLNTYPDVQALARVVVQARTVDLTAITVFDVVADDPALLPDRAHLAATRLHGLVVAPVI